MTSVAESGQAYDSLFYEYQRAGATRSANAVVPVITNALAVHSVLDVGCGAGAWIAAYRNSGITDYVGVDGNYVDRSMLLVDAHNFEPRDITKEFDFAREFDLVQCLEVAEHVTPACSGILVDNLARHGKKILFSAAVPGQGGKDHINEQSYDYWRDMFAARRYRLLDFVRPAIRSNLAVEPWYRYNILFFAHDSIMDRLPARLRATRVSETESVSDFSPIGYRIRKLLLRSLPSKAVSALSVTKHKMIVRSLRRRGN